jgi:hypothetical protein
MRNEIEDKYMDAKELLEAYRQLWSNRALPVENDEVETLRASIEKELKDEMTHPRLRKNPHVKFHLSIKRIVSSTLNDDQKVKLIDWHIKVLETIQK